MFSITGAYVICTDATANDITPADGADFYALVVLNLIVCVFAALSTLLLLMKLYAVCATSAIHARGAPRLLLRPASVHVVPQSKYRDVCEVRGTWRFARSLIQTGAEVVQWKAK